MDKCRGFQIERVLFMFIVMFLCVYLCDSYVYGYVGEIS